MLYREDGKIIPVSKKDLPITLPPIKGLGGANNDIGIIDSWKNTVCPETGMKAVRETDTFDTVKHTTKKIAAAAPNNSQYTPFQSVDDKIGPLIIPTKSNIEIIETKVVSFSIPTETLTIPGIEIFNACGKN